LFHRWVRKFSFIEFQEAPWTPFVGPVHKSRVALITTGGVHIRSDRPFDMQDPSGDPSFRIIPGDAVPGDLTITHNYYDHGDADKDVNIVFPVERIRALAALGEIGDISQRHFSFMGHVLPPHIDTLIHKTSLAMARALKKDEVDLAILTPA
jgi:D-proline reductase (dithiol) PrdB